MVYCLGSMIYFVKTSNDIFILGKQHESAIGLELCVNTEADLEAKGVRH